MAADLEEVIEDADILHLDQASPDRGQHLLQRRRRSFRPTRPRARTGRRNGASRKRSLTANRSRQPLDRDRHAVSRRPVWIGHYLRFRRAAVRHRGRDASPAPAIRIDSAISGDVDSVDSRRSRVS
jgi:hypothetical protein